MAIIGLHSENVKRVKVADIRCGHAPSVKIGGRNAQGKTSVMDSIIMAIQGGKSIPKRPVREGADSATIILETDDLVIQRVIAPDRSTKLVVTNRDGAKFSGAQKMLDKLLGSLSFDPLAFSKMKPDDQETALRELLGIDTRKLDAMREIAFTTRTDVNREVKALQAQVDGMASHPDLPDEELSAVEIQEALNEAKKHNAECDLVVDAYYDAKDAYEAVEARIAACDAEITRLMELLKVQQRTRATLKQEVIAMEPKIAEAANAATLIKKIDEDEIVQRLVSVSDTNRKIAENKMLADRMKVLATKQAETDALTADIKSIDQQKSDLLASAKYPVPGLAIAPEGGITLNGFPLEQASAAEALKTGVAICVAMNPEFPVALIRDASLLDDDTLAMVEQFAVEHGCQVWMERVGHGEECQVIIEDGLVVTNRFEQAEQPTADDDHPKAVQHKPFAELFPVESEDLGTLEIPKRTTRKRPQSVPPVV
jgi:hypothetical protein